MSDLAFTRTLPPRWHAVFRDAERDATAMLKQEQEHPRLFLLYCDGAEPIELMVPKFADDPEDSGIEELKTAIAAFNPDALICISEAWTTSYPSARPSQCSDRQEVLMAFMTVRMQGFRRVAASTRPILRDDSGAVVGLGEPIDQFEEGKPIDCYIPALLPRTPISKKLQQAAVARFRQDAANTMPI